MALTITTHPLYNQEFTIVLKESTDTKLVILVRLDELNKEFFDSNKEYCLSLIQSCIEDDDIDIHYSFKSISEDSAFCYIIEYNKSVPNIMPKYKY